MSGDVVDIGQARLARDAIRTAEHARATGQAITDRNALLDEVDETLAGLTRYGIRVERLEQAKDGPGARISDQG